MLQKAQGFANAPSYSEDHTIIQTSLYDLVEAVNTTVNLNDDQFVVEIAMDLLNVCHAKFQNACR